MKNKLLITTALVALSVSGNAYAENLPEDATNLTSGNYVVERSDTQVSHSGDINLSGTASLDVKTQAIVEEEADEVDVSKTLNVSGNVSLADDASLSVINSDATDETEKPFMFVDGKYTQTGGELTLKQENGAGWRSTLNAKEADISSGTIKLDTGEIFIYGNADDGSQFNISGGTFEMNDSNISTYPAMSDGDNSQKGAAMTVSGGTFKMNESSLGRENSGDLDISGGEFTLENGSAIFHDGETGDINISGGTISLKDSSIIRGGDYQSEDGKPASGNINITGGTINVSGSSAEIASVGNIKIANGAELNIALGSTLFAKAFTEDMSQAQKATLNVYDNDTRINLGGKLVANINGDDRGKIHFQNSNAKIDGNVEDVSLIFEDSHSLNNAISGNIGGLDILAINKGTLTFDKEPTDTITTVQVGNGATLDIGDKTLHSTGDKADGEGVIFADNSTLAFTVTDKDTYGKIHANYVNISENGTNLNMTLNGAALAKGETTTLKLFNGEKFDEVQEKLEGVLETVETTVCSKFGVSNEIFNKENIKKVLIIAGVLAVVFVAYGKKIKGEGTAENAKFTELLKGVAPIIPVVVLVFPQLKKVFSKFMKDEDMVVNNTAVTEEGAVDAEVVSSDETEESFETGSEDKVVENAENAEMKTDSCGNETTSETVTDSSENETATDEN